MSVFSFVRGVEKAREERVCVILGVAASMELAGSERVAVGVRVFRRGNGLTGAGVFGIGVVFRT